MSTDFAKAQQYKYQGKTAIYQGQAQKAAYEHEARGLETEARSDAHIASNNMRRMRENQDAAAGSATVARGAGNLSTAGSGQLAEISVVDAWEQAIDDANLSNAINYGNKQYAADMARSQGDMAMMQAESTARQYRQLQSNALGAAIIQTVATVAGAGYGGFTGGMSGAIAGGYNAYSMAGSLNSMVPGSMGGGAENGSKLWAQLMSGDKTFGQLFSGGK